MLGVRKTVVLCSAALLVACEPVSEPEVGPPLPTLDQRGAVASSVAGSGNTLVNGQLRNFSFTALEIGGLVDGEFELRNHSNGFRVHGIITCFLIHGNNANEALIGGQVTHTASGPIGGRPEVAFRVVDNPGRTPDQISLLVSPVDLGLPDDAGAFCGPPPPAEALALAVTDIVHGNIKVHDNPPAAP